jgi:hypothetical protein
MTDLPSAFDLSDSMPSQASNESVTNTLPQMEEPSLEDRKHPIQSKPSYQNSITYIRYVLGQFDRAQGMENKSNLVKKLFEFLIAHPTILIYEPRFRHVVEKKGKEIQEQLESRIREFDESDLPSMIDDVTTTVTKCVMHRALRTSILNKLKSIDEELHAYKYWANDTDIRILLESMHNTFQYVKNHPDYVAE